MKSSTPTFSAFYLMAVGSFLRDSYASSIAVTTSRSLVALVRICFTSPAIVRHSSLKATQRYYSFSVISISVVFLGTYRFLHKFINSEKLLCYQAMYSFLSFYSLFGPKSCLNYWHQLFCPLVISALLFTKVHR